MRQSHRWHWVPDAEVFTMWRQSSPEAFNLRRAIRQQIEQLLRGSYEELHLQGTPQRFIGLLHDIDFVDQNSSTDDQL
jgi:hypothetical protein